MASLVAMLLMISIVFCVISIIRLVPWLIVKHFGMLITEAGDLDFEVIESKYII